jgi:hypothetical protein
VLRCKDKSHKTITKYFRSERELVIEKEWRRTNGMNSTALTKMPEQQMQQRIDMAKFPQQLTETDKKILTQAAITYGFDPLMGEISIYQGRPYVSLEGRYRKAQETEMLDGVQTAPATKEERAEWQIPDGDYFFKADIYVKGCSHPFTGWGRVRADETKPGSKNDATSTFKPIQNNPQRMAEKRAESQGLKKAFHIPLPSIEDIGSEETQPEVKQARNLSDIPTEVIMPDKKPEKKQHRDPSGLKTFGELCQYCYDEWKMMPRDILAECNVTDSKDIPDFPAAARNIAAVRG